MVKAPTRDKHLRDYDKAKGPLHSWIAPWGFFSDTAVITKSGDLFTVLELSGVDLECMEAPAIADVCKRFESALKTLGPEYRVYQYLIKRDSPDLPSMFDGNQLERNRAVYLDSRRTELYGVKLYVVVLRRCTSVEQKKAWLLNLFSHQRTLELSMKETVRAAQALRIKTESLCVQLSRLVAPRILTKQETAYFLTGLVNLTPWKAEIYGAIPNTHLDQYISSSELHCWEDYVKCDDYHIKLLSMIDPPGADGDKTPDEEYEYARIVRRLLSVKSNFIACTEWQQEPNDKMIRTLDAHRFHHHSALTSLWQYLGNRHAQSQDVLKDKSEYDVIDILDRAKTEITSLKERNFGRFSFTVGLFDTSQPRLQASVAELTEIVGSQSGRMVEERYGMMRAWSSLIPGNYRRGVRSMWLLNASHADMGISLFRPWQGSPINYHLGGKPALAVLETREGVPFHLNLHGGDGRSDVANSLVLGATGSGKSFLVNFLASGYQKYGPYTVIFELGGAYRSLTRHYGGEHLHIGKEQLSVHINPFSLEPSKENLGFLFSFMLVLIERDGYTLDDSDREDLFKLIKEHYLIAPEKRTLSEFAKGCRSTYAGRLSEWVGSGRLASYFDNQNDTLSFARFQAFDFQGLEDNATVLQPLLFYILHRVSGTVHDPAEAKTPKLVVCDEAWRFFENPITRAYIHEALKTWRKRNGAMIIATQSATDLKKSGLLDTFRENCPNRFFLANRFMDRVVYEETFGLNKRESEIITNLQPAHELLLQQPEGSKVLRLNVDDESFKIFANKER